MLTLTWTIVRAKTLNYSVNEILETRGRYKYGEHATVGELSLDLFYTQNSGSLNILICLIAIFAL